MTALEKIAVTLENARINANLTQSDLARRLSRTQSFVWKVENLSRKIGVEEFFWLCHALKIDAHAILAQAFPAGCSFQHLYVPEPKQNNKPAFDPSEWAYDSDEFSGDEEDEVDDGDAWDFGVKHRRKADAEIDENAPDDQSLLLSPLLSKKPPKKYQDAPVRFRKP